MAVLKIKQAGGAWLVVEDPSALRIQPQDLNDTQKESARQNIDAVSTTELETVLAGKVTVPDDPRMIVGYETAYFGYGTAATVEVLSGMTYKDQEGHETNFVISANPTQFWQGTDSASTIKYSENVLVAREGRSGQIKVPDVPNDNNDATSKKYVTEQVAAKVDKLTTNQVVYARGTAAAPGDKGITYTTSSSGSTLVYRDGGGYFSMKDPTNAEHGATKNYVDTNFVAKEATSQTITGNLILTGDFTVKGTTKTQDAQTQLIEENIIELNSGKVLNEAQLSGVVINKNAESAYGIVYDPSSDAVKLGLGETSGGEFSFKPNEGTPIATREEFDDEWLDEAIFVFDKKTKKFKYSGKTLSSFKKEIEDTMKTYVANYIETYMPSETTIDENGNETYYVDGKETESLSPTGGTILEVGGTTGGTN